MTESEGNPRINLENQQDILKVKKRWGIPEQAGIQLEQNWIPPYAERYPQFLPPLPLREREWTSSPRTGYRHGVICVPWDNRPFPFDGGRLGWGWSCKKLGILQRIRGMMEFTLELLLSPRRSWRFIND